MPQPKPSRWIDLFPGRVKAMREKAGLSQRQLALKVGISRAFVALIESGKRVPSLNVVGRIMDECSEAVGTKKAAESWMKITENGQHHEDSKKRSAHDIGQIASKE
jgi:transcriptional regulator with XRE-family HTH domain